jgi:hypothetical protein
MSLNRYAKRRDATEPEIVLHLRAWGFQVKQQDFPDLAVRNPTWPPGIARLLEINGITRNRKRNAKQVKFLEDWKIPVVKNFDEALSALNSPTV